MCCKPSVMYQSVLWCLLTIPLTARLISISSKSLWSSMAATSQRYSAVSERVVLKIRMLAGSLSWALCSKSPFKRGKKTLYNCSFTYTAWLHSSEKQNSLPSSFKVPFIQLSFESPNITLKWSMGFSRRESLRAVYLLSCFESTHNWGHRF